MVWCDSLEEGDSTSFLPLAFSYVKNLMVVTNKSTLIKTMAQRAGTEDVD